MATPTPRINLFRNSEYEAVPAGTLVFAAGDDGDCMFAVRKGEVELIVGDRIVEVVTEGGIFGEMALIEGAERTATARAKAETELVRIDAVRFEFMVRQTPHFARSIMQLLAQRLRRANALALS